MLMRQCGQSCSAPSATPMHRSMQSTEITAVAAVTAGAVIPSRPTQVPSIKEEFVKNLIERLYEAAVIKLTSMNSYEDKTYLVETAGMNSRLGNAERCVFKITNAVDSHNGTIESQTKLLQHLGKAGINCQQPVRNRSGEFWSLEALEYVEGHEHHANCEAETPRHIVRLLTYIPGELLINVPYTTGLLQDIGRFLGQLHAALATFRDSVYESRNTIWSFDNAACLLEFVPYLNSIEKRQKVTEVIETFQERMKLVRKLLPSGIIHSDFNEQNILVSKISNHSFGLAHSSEEYRVTGILDFGDSHHSCNVFDLASAILYAILDSKGEFSWTDICRHITTGYLSMRTLSQAEQDIVLLCICMRLAQSLILGWYTYQLKPTADNAYVLATQQKGWTVLDQIWLAFKKGIE